jgi:hypothetical protein
MVGSPGHICFSGGVNNKGRPSQPSPLSQRAIDRDGCDDGDVQRLLLWSVHAYMPQAKGVLPGDIPIRGARAQHFATVRHKNKVCRFAVRTRPRRPAGVSAVVCGMAGTQKVRTSVRTGFAGLHPGQTKNGQGRKLNAGAGLQPFRWLGCRNRPTSLCARSDAADTVLRNSLHACACARLTASYDNLCPMRQTRRGMSKGIQKLDTLGDQ